MTPDFINRSERDDVEKNKLSLADAVAYQLNKHNIPVSKCAAEAGVDRAQLTYWLKKKVRLRDDAIERLLLTVGLTIATKQGWKPPSALMKELPGPAPKKRARSRPNNKPR